MTINFPDLKEVIKIYNRKGAKRPLLTAEKTEKTRDKITISEEARKLAQKISRKEDNLGG
ncbi:hypothetical protein TDIS_0673 [Thermosulfurimonas dismutans]|uniref:Uncharacterized protein n=1 Tax=Thermosulfurimonas dismutans TaxID=999894 RepID=A0A179D7M6_9BACT|nr:hypothetical protein TDIS_0673 [Thermosulfurimonas dismutans]